MARKGTTILKYSGEQALYDESKLKQSLEKTGASDIVIDQILVDVNGSLYDGITTKEIYHKAFKMLRKHSRPTAARYKLKKAIMELGPSGFPFEQYVGRVLEQQGYNTRIGIIIKGLCVDHEIDVIASKQDNRYMVECKYHTEQGRYSHVKVPLYIHSRFQDVVNGKKQKDEQAAVFKQGWIYTNTRFTSDALKYGQCVGLKMIGWDQPAKGGLKESIDKAGLYPVTCLTSMTMDEKQALLKTDTVLCSELIASPSILKKIGVSATRQKYILDEANSLCREQIESKK